jgi:opacity protein-like surface antigen
MKHTLIAVALALASSTALAQAAPTASNGQSNLQVSNGQYQTQTTVPSDKSKPSGGNTEGQKGQPVQGEKVDAWSLLGRGWNQFDNAGKQ